jgi:hypothetical protein
LNRCSAAAVIPTLSAGPEWSPPTMPSPTININTFATANRRKKLSFSPFVRISPVYEGVSLRVESLIVLACIFGVRE